MIPLRTSPPTRKGLRGIRSIHGAITRGNRNPGISWAASTKAEAMVLPVSSNTRNDMAKPPAMPPMAPSPVAAISRVKLRFHSLVCIFSHLRFIIAHG